MSADGRYLVRAYTAQDREPLRALTREVWPDADERVFDRRWWWKWEEPPLQLVEDTADHRIVGFCAFLRFALYFQGGVHPSAWLVDFFVSPQHRRTGLGTRLARSIMEQFLITASLSQTAAAWSTFRGLGWSPRRTAKLYVKVLPGLFGGVRWLGRFGLRNSPLRVEAGAAAECGIGSEFDELWQRVADRFGAISVRDAETLRARYGQVVDQRYTLLRCYRDGALAGYMVTRTTAPGAVRSLPGCRVGLIVDYLVDPAEPVVFRALLARAAVRVRDERARYLLCLSTAPAVERALSRHGFLHSGTPVVGRRLSRLNVGFTFTTQAEHNELQTVPWFLTLGDCDMDLVWQS